MEVVVVGAGPAGLAAALGLLAAGHDVQVLERSPVLRTGGGAVTLSSGGTAALAALGLDVGALGRRLDVLDSRTDDGRPLMRVPLGELGRRVGTPTTSVLRRTLVARLAERLPPGVLRLGADVVDVEAHRRRPLVRLDGGDEVVADVLVGADGETSGVRRALRPGALGRRTGWTTWQGCWAPGAAAPAGLRDLVDGHRVLFMTGPAGFCDLQPAGDGLLQWSVSTPGGAVGGGDPRATLRARFAAWADPLPDVLHLAPGPPQPWPHRRGPVPPVWGAGAVTLVGDAAHVMPPSLGQGVNQGLEDAHALAAALAGHPADVVAALRGYERRRAGQVRPVALLAGSEQAITHRALSRRVMRSLPDAWALGLWGAMVRRSSAALPGRAEPTHDLTCTDGRARRQGRHRPRLDGGAGRYDAGVPRCSRTNATAARSSSMPPPSWPL